MDKRVLAGKHFADSSAHCLLLVICFSLMSMACNQPAATSENQSKGTNSVATIRITPADVELSIGQKMQLSVRLGDAAGNMLPVRKNTFSLTKDSTKKSATVIGDTLMRAGRRVDWQSDAPDRVRINANGQITALSPGVVIITATCDGQSGKTRIVVSKPSGEPITVMPGGVKLHVGEALQFKPMLQGANGKLQPGPIRWHSDQPALASISSNGLFKAKAAGVVTVSAFYKEQTGTATVTVAPVETIYGIDFPGNAGVNKTMRFDFKSPLAAYPATYIWRAYPRQQQSYYTAFFWGNNGSFYRFNTYYGFHPYPDWDTSYQHFWEIAAPPGRDFVSQQHVVYDRWYIQVAICKRTENKTIYEFYWDWPNTTKVVRHEGDQYEDPPIPGLIIGDAPWNPGNEVWDGVLRGFQFYDIAMTKGEIAQEIASPGAVRIPWYLNLNPTASDISDKSGNGHDPSWVGNERPSQWTGSVIGGTIAWQMVLPM